MNQGLNDNKNREWSSKRNDQDGYYVPSDANYYISEAKASSFTSEFN